MTLLLTACGEKAVSGDGTENGQETDNATLQATIAATPEPTAEAAPEPAVEATPEPTTEAAPALTEAAEPTMKITPKPTTESNGTDEWEVKEDGVSDYREYVRWLDEFEVTSLDYASDPYGCSLRYDGWREFEATENDGLRDTWDNVQLTDYAVSYLLGREDFLYYTVYDGVGSRIEQCNWKTEIMRSGRSRSMEMTFGCMQGIKTENRSQ